MTKALELFLHRWEVEGRNWTEQVLGVQVGGTAAELRRGQELIPYHLSTAWKIRPRFWDFIISLLITMLNFIVSWVTWERDQWWFSVSSVG